MSSVRLDVVRAISLSSVIACSIGALTGVGCSSSGADGSSTTGGPGGDAFSITPTTLTFTARSGALRPDPQTVQVTPHAKVYLKTTVSGDAVDSATIEYEPPNARVVVQAAAPVDVPDGTSMGSVKIVGCVDTVCSSEVPGSPKQVAVTYVKSIGGITGMPNTLAFKHPFGTAAPPSQDVAIRGLADESLAWTAAVEYQDPTSIGWLVLGAMSGVLPATVNVSVKPPAKAGSYEADVVFREGTTSLFTVPVTYAQSADFQVMPPTINVVGMQGTPTPDQSISLQDATGVSYSWTARVEYVDGAGWASVSPEAGNTLPATVTLSLGTIPAAAGTQSAVLRITGAGVEKLVQVYYRQPP